MIFKKSMEVRWSDIDANQHLTHTAYAVFSTHTRVMWMESIGYSMADLLRSGFSAVFLKEQTEYFCEIYLGEMVHIELHFAGESEDHSHWKFVQKFLNSQGKLSAINTVYGAWIDAKTRKISAPPPVLLDKFCTMSKDDNFENLRNLLS